MTQRIELNGEVRTLSAENVEALLLAERIDPQASGVAVALNGAVVPRRRWSRTSITSGDRVEIVKPFSGG